MVPWDYAREVLPEVEKVLTREQFDRLAGTDDIFFGTSNVVFQLGPRVVPAHWSPDELYLTVSRGHIVVIDGDAVQGLDSQPVIMAPIRALDRAGIAHPMPPTVPAAEPDGGSGADVDG